MRFLGWCIASLLISFSASAESITFSTPIEVRLEAIPVAAGRPSPEVCDQRASFALRGLANAVGEVYEYNRILESTVNRPVVAQADTLALYRTRVDGAQARSQREVGELEGLIAQCPELRRSFQPYATQHRADMSAQVAAFNAAYVRLQRQSAVIQRYESQQIAREQDSTRRFQDIDRMINVGRLNQFNR